MNGSSLNTAFNYVFIIGARFAPDGAGAQPRGGGEWAGARGRRAGRPRRGDHPPAVHGARPVGELADGLGLGGHRDDADPPQAVESR